MKKIKQAAGYEFIEAQTAKMYLDCNKKNRPVKQATVDYYAKEMEAGRWLVTGEAIQFDVDGNLINGQHRLLAIIKSNTTQQMLVVRNLEREAFMAIDKGTPRTDRDIFTIYDIPSANVIAAGIRKYIRLRTFGGLATALNTHNHNLRVSTQELLEYYKMNSSFIHEAHQMAASMYGAIRLYTTSDILAVAMYLCLEKRYNQEFVFQFFHTLFDCGQDAERNFMPCDYLRKMITRDFYSDRRMSTTFKMQLLVKAWNCWVEDKNLKILVIQDGEKVAFK